MVELNRIYNEDCLKTIEKIDDNAIDLVLTSPPYFLNKDYEKTWTYSYYCELMGNVFKGVHRILKDGGHFVINFGDYFNSNNRFYDADVPSVFPASINVFKWGIDANFDLQATRIWRKQFSRMGIPFVCNKHPRNIFDYEHIWTFRKKGGDTREFVNDRKLSQRGVIGDDWTSSAKLGQHQAAFPIELPTWAINVYTKENDIVYDPFIGTGTTAIGCIESQKHPTFIGSEISEKQVNYAFNRIKKKLEESTTHT